jgi:hypothetical protein
MLKYLIPSGFGFLLRLYLILPFKTKNSKFVLFQIFFDITYERSPLNIEIVFVWASDHQFLHCTFASRKVDHIGLVHLIWENPVDFQANIFKKYTQTPINDFVNILNKIKNGIYIQISQDQKSFFQFFQFIKYF